MIMKIPNGTEGNGYCNQDLSIIPYLSDNDSSHSDDIDSPNVDGDFSEYMWMENEEEFDEQVLKQLEEEALMEQCIEAMLDEERETAANSQAPASRQQWSPSDLTQPMGNLDISEDLAKGSKLNPDAVEFVPKQPQAPIEGKV